MHFYQTQECIINKLTNRINAFAENYIFTRENLNKPAQFSNSLIRHRILLFKIKILKY